MLLGIVGSVVTALPWPNEAVQQIHISELLVNRDVFLWHMGCFFV
jgi:hypothetical protein